jgi:hypothetical protein
MKGCDSHLILIILIFILYAIYYNLSKRRNNLSKRRNRVSKRRNKVSKRRNKVSKRRNTVTKCRNNHKLLAGAYHKCYYVDNWQLGRDRCNGYYYDNDGWYYWKGMALTEEGRWESTKPTNGGFQDVCGGEHYVCPKCVDKYKERLKNLKRKLEFNDTCFMDLSGSDGGTNTGSIANCPPPKQYSNITNLPGNLTREKIYEMALAEPRIAGRRTFEVIEKLCGSETPYLTDNGYCCSPTVE